MLGVSERDETAPVGARLGLWGTERRYPPATHLLRAVSERATITKNSKISLRGGNLSAAQTGW